MRINKEKYIQYAEEQQQCVLSGDYKQGNKYANKLIEFNSIIEETEGDIANSLIDGIINSDKPNAVMWISLVCAKRKYRVEEIKAKLTKYSIDRDLSVFALNAKVTLQELEKMEA